jgi:hypothetical protein
MLLSLSYNRFVWLPYLYHWLVSPNTSHLILAMTGKRLNAIAWKLVQCCYHVRTVYLSLYYEACVRTFWRASSLYKVIYTMSIWKCMMSHIFSFWKLLIARWIWQSKQTCCRQHRHSTRSSLVFLSVALLGNTQYDVKTTCVLLNQGAIIYFKKNQGAIVEVCSVGPL